MEQRQSDEVRQWERDWRESIQSQVSDTARTLSDVAGLVREMQSDVKELMQWRNDDARRRDDRIEKVPDTRRADMAIAVSVLTALIYLVTLLAAHWKP